MGERSCGGCQACCEVMTIHDARLEKPMHTPCRYQCEAGCSIHTDRPWFCRQYQCAWLDGWGEDEHRPDRLGVMLDFLVSCLEGGPDIRYVRVSETRPGALEGSPRAAELVTSLSESLVVQLVWWGPGADSFGGPEELKLELRRRFTEHPGG